LITCKGTNGYRERGNILFFLPTSFQKNIATPWHGPTTILKQRRVMPWHDQTRIKGILCRIKTFLGMAVKRPRATFYFLKIISENIFISFHESLSASALYSIGILNFLPVSVEAGFVNACVAFG
jgi:hypothetical protein